VTGGETESRHWSVERRAREGAGILSGGRRKGVPHPRVFWAKSVETHENKRVEFCVTAKKRKRVRKNVKRKGIVRKQVEMSAGLNIRTLKSREHRLPPWFCKRLRRLGLGGGGLQKD